MFSNPGSIKLIVKLNRFSLFIPLVPNPIETQVLQLYNIEHASPEGDLVFLRQMIKATYEHKRDSRRNN